MLLGQDTFRRLCRARDLLAEVREQPLSIREVARRTGISPFHFIRQFEALFGVTPHQFRIQARLDQAKGKPADFQGWLGNAERSSWAMEEALKAGDGEAAAAALDGVGANCASCHAAYRNNRR